MEKQPASEDDQRSDRHCLPPIPMAAAAPWLVFPHGTGRKFQSFYNPCEPTVRNCIKSIPELQGRAYYHKPSHQGWLIVIGGVEYRAGYSVANSNLDDCFLWNPVSSQTIRLPNLSRQSFSTESKPYFMYDLVLSSPPSPLQSTAATSVHDNLDCLVYLLFKRVNYRKGRNLQDRHVLVFCRPADQQWNAKVLSLTPPGDDRNILSIESLVCFRGKLYAFCGSSMEDGWVAQIEIQQLWHHVVDNKQTQYINIIKLKQPDFTWIGGGFEFPRYMEHWIESGDEIFKVHLSCTPRGFRKVASTHIFKLDFSSMTWVQVKTLDDHVLFLCANKDVSETTKCYSTSTACCSAAEMGLERGCLFYTLPQDPTLYTFEVEDNSTTEIMPFLELPTPCFLPTWIFMPITVNRRVAGRRRSITDLLVSQDTTNSSIEEDIGRLNMNGEELQELKQWDTRIDYDSTEEIARFLHPVDYVHFRLACKQTSAVLPALNRISASTRATETTYLSPWLISIVEENRKTICELVDPMHNNEKYLMKLSDQLLVDATIRFSKDGWLLLSNGKKTVFCYNPFTRAMIRLPDLPDDYVLGAMSFSSIPTSCDCVVIAISNWWEMTGDNEISFLVAKPGKSAASWDVHQFTYRRYSTRENFMPCINNPVFYNKAFYCLDYNGMLGVFNMEGNPSWKVLAKSLKQFGGFYPSYLVECDGKLLLVNIGRIGKLIETYRLDDLEMVWVKLNSLGKHALFTSYTSSFSAVAPRSCMQNNIYFPRLQGERILYYSLDTCRYHFVGSNQHSA